jgi:regulator of protease activity HflC (stomatin/prohibitin superfamily)
VVAKKRVFESGMFGSSQSMFVRVPVENCSNGDAVVVDESCTAIIIKNGQMHQTLVSGKHNLLSFGTNKDSFAIVFVAKTSKFKMLWGTKEQFSFRDPVEDVLVKVGANGQVDVQITNPRKFYLEFGKQKDDFKISDLKENIHNRLLSIIEQQIATYMNNQKLSYDRLDENKSRVAEEIRPYVSNQIEKDFGIRISLLTINGVLLPNQTNLASAKTQKLDQTKQKTQQLEQEQKQKTQQSEQALKQQLQAQQQAQLQQMQAQQQEQDQEQEQEGMLLL